MQILLQLSMTVKLFTLTLFSSSKKSRNSLFFKILVKLIQPCSKPKASNSVNVRVALDLLLCDHWMEPSSYFAACKTKNRSRSVSHGQSLSLSDAQLAGKDERKRVNLNLFCQIHYSFRLFRQDRMVWCMAIKF